MRLRVFDRLRAELPGVPVAAIVTVAVALHVVAAWFNGGFLSSDEHFQILEFAQYKLGLQPASALAWEFGAAIRPALQPWLAAGIIRGWLSAGVSSPFVIAFSMRLLSTMLGMWVTLELCVRTLPDVRHRALRLAAVLTALFLWMTPLVQDRFSSENWGAALLVGGLCLMLDAADSWTGRRRRAYLLAAATGLVWSAAFYCRFQIGFAIAGAGLWLLIVPRRPVRLVMMIGSAFIAGCLLNTLVDHWFYGAWVFTPYAYAHVDLMDGKAATFGVSPWWTTALYLAAVLVPPYSVPILMLYVAGAWFARRHVLVWAVVPFLVMHAAIPHKEIRFFFPLVYVAGPLFAVCVDALPGRLTTPLFAWLRTPWGRVNLALLAVFNAALLATIIVLPAHETYGMFQWLWDTGRERPLTVYAVGNSPYGMPPGPLNSFYRPAHVRVAPVTSAGQLQDARRGGAPVFVYYDSLDPPAIVLAGAPGCTPVVQTFPIWLPPLDALHVLDGADRATICRVDPPRAAETLATPAVPELRH